MSGAPIRLAGILQVVRDRRIVEIRDRAGEYKHEQQNRGDNG